jgi:hypothetical protein
VHPPSPTEIRLQVEEICRTALDGAPRRRDLFRHIVESTLAYEHTTEKAIAFKIYNRPASFDPAIDSIVRVEMRKLREAVKEFYGGAGQTAPIRIDFEGYSIIAQYTEYSEMTTGSLTLSMARASYDVVLHRFMKKLAELGFLCPYSAALAFESKGLAEWTIDYDSFTEFGDWNALEFGEVHPFSRLSEPLQLYIKEQGFHRAILNHTDGIRTYYHLPSRGLRIKKLSEGDIIVNYLPAPGEPGFDDYGLLFRYCAIVGTDNTL